MSESPRGPAVDVVCAGEAMAMFVPQRSGALTPDTLYRISAAGAEANVARYLSQLGAATAWVSRLGGDPFGDFIAGELSDDGVAVRADTTPLYPTGVAFKDRSRTETTIHYYRARSAASTLDASSANDVWSLRPRIVHLSGITPALSPSCRDFMTNVAKEKPVGSKISFDVNWRPSLWSNHEGNGLRTFAQSADIVFVGLDEAQDLWDIHDADAVRAYIDRPETLVVKRGPAGCTVFKGAQRVDIPALVVEVVEPVGAGDAFAAGFLWGELNGDGIHRSARIGTVIASSALSVSADVGQVPQPQYLEKLLQLADAEWVATRYSPAEAMRSGASVPNR